MTISARVTGTQNAKKQISMITINLMMMMMLKTTILVINTKTEAQGLTTKIKARAKYGLLR